MLHITVLSHPFIKTPNSLSQGNFYLICLVSLTSPTHFAAVLPPRCNLSLWYMKQDILAVGSMCTGHGLSV